MSTQKSLLTTAALALGGIAIIQTISLAEVPTTAPSTATSPAIATPPPTPSLTVPPSTQPALAPSSAPALLPISPIAASPATSAPTTQRGDTVAKTPTTGQANPGSIVTGQTISPTAVGRVVVTSDLDRDRDQIAPPLGASTYTIGPNQIEATPEGDNATFQQTLLRAPGVVEDNDGQIHVRGEHANLTYRLNGILLPDAINAFGQAVDTRLVQSATLIDGTLPAQFGFRTAGIVDIITKSGDNLNSNEISIYGGRNETFQPSIQLGGTRIRTSSSIIQFWHIRRAPKSFRCRRRPSRNMERFTSLLIQSMI
jgi:hypothetical protein